MNVSHKYLNNILYCIELYFRDHGEFEKATAVGHDFESTSYMNQCGWEGFYWGSKRRTHFLFSDSHVTGEYKHAGRGDSFRPVREGGVRSRRIQYVVCLCFFSV
jgi:hypothetical protein